MRTGKRRSASAIMKPELAAIVVFHFCSKGASHTPALEVHMVGVPVPTSLCSPAGCRDPADTDAFW
jgi:hypothetical protein